MAIAHVEPVGTTWFVLDPTAQIAGARANLWRYLRSRRAWIRMGIGIVLLSLFGALVGVVLDEDPLVWLVTFAVEFVVLVPLIYGLLALTLPFRIRRLSKQSRIWEKPVDATWSPAGLSLSQAAGNCELAWAEYHGWYAARCGFLLYLNDMQYQQIPAQALDASQAAELRAILETSGLRRL